MAVAATVAVFTVMSPVGAGRAATAAPSVDQGDAVPEAVSAIDNATRSSVRQAYLDTLAPALEVPLGWTGSVAGCNAGAPSAAAQTATLDTVNWFREMAGLPPVSFDSSFSAMAQAAALMMHAEGVLSHAPDPSWACYTPDGATGASRSNLVLGASGAEAVALYLVDPGVGNYAVGHRRWILNPRATTMGSGSTSNANALYVVGAGTSGPRPSSPDWVPWPTAGFFPTTLEPGGRWSLSANEPDTDFSGASVTVTRDGQPLVVTLEPVVDGYGDPTLVWQIDPGHTSGMLDTTYEVTVDGIVRNGLPTTHQYSVTLFDPAIDPDQTIAFAGLPGRVYGDGPLTLTATASSSLPVAFSSTTPAVCSTSGPNGKTLTLHAAGTCTVHANQPGDGFYHPAPQVTHSFSVAKKTLTVTPDDQERTVVSPNPPLTVTYSGFVLGQSLATSGVTGAPNCSTPATAASPVGSYPIDCTPGSLAAANYGFTFGTGTLTVVPDLPGPPTAVSAAPGERSADVSWTAPADTGGGPLTGFRITRSPGGAITDVGPGVTVRTITGLSVGTPYTFTVRAMNAAGLGPTSAATAPVVPVGFSDVASSNAFHDDIIWLALSGITGGYPDGTFRPDEGVTRKAMAAFLYRAAGSPAYTPPTTPTFPDVPTSHPFRKEIEWLAASNITGGYPDGTFRPDEGVTRKAMAAFLHRAASSNP